MAPSMGRTTFLTSNFIYVESQDVVVLSLKSFKQSGALRLREDSCVIMVWERCWFIGWGGDGFVGSPLRAVDMRKYDGVWGAAKGRQDTELAIVLATLCVSLIHNHFLKGLIVQEVLKAESCLLGVEWGFELEPERNAMCRY